jgi:hypothetical protein
MHSEYMMHYTYIVKLVLAVYHISYNKRVVAASAFKRIIFSVLICKKHMYK